MSERTPAATPVEVEKLYASPNALAGSYSRFRVTERLLFTGHSHQAWPDVAFEAQQQAWLDAAHFVDDKWGPAFERADRVRAGYAALLGDTSGGKHIALAENTHELLVRLFSALDWARRPRLVLTDGEFYSARRQADRMEEAGAEVVRVPSLPVDDVASRIAAQVDDRTAVVVISSVFFLNGRIVPGLHEIAQACQRHGATLIVDAYHHMNVIPFDVHEMGLDSAYIVGAGYKYCQMGEGNAFMRLPADCLLRPVVTGWYTEFGELASHRAPGVQYGEGGHRFAGATYDPASHYRGARVFDFFVEQGLSPSVLREVSQHQIGVLMDSFDALDTDPAIVTRDRNAPRTEIGGFLALTSSRAGDLQRFLKAKDVYTDYRGDVLRFGPAPYLSDNQLRQSMSLLGEAVRSL